MLRRHEKVWSPALGRDVCVLAYGHYGPPAIAFPSGKGSYTDFENFGMIDALAHLLDGGKMKLYCPESNDTESWLADWGDCGHRAWRHKCYEDFILANLVPAIREDCKSSGIRIATTGCSWGAYHAVNFALKFPEVFHYALGMSGRYDLGKSLGSNYNEDAYFNDPLAYMMNIGGDALERVKRHTHVALVCGQGAWEDKCLDETHRLAGHFAAKGVSHEKDIWGHDVEHHWYWWRKQIAHHFGKAVG